MHEDRGAGDDTCVGIDPYGTESVCHDGTCSTPVTRSRDCDVLPMMSASFTAIKLSDSRAQVCYSGCSAADPRGQSGRTTACCWLLGPSSGRSRLFACLASAAWGKSMPRAIGK